MKKLISLLIPLFLTLSSYSQNPLPYYTGFDNTQEQNGWAEYKKGINTNSSWFYGAFSPYSAPNNLSHYYPVGGSQVTEDWFVSPSIDLTNGGVIDSIWHAYGGFGMPFGDDTVALYLLTGNQDPSLSTSRTLLILLSDSTYINDDVWRYHTQINISSTIESAYLGIQYKTTNNWLDVRFDNLYIIADSSNHIIEQSTQLDHQISIFPNPSSNNIQVQIHEEIKIENIELLDISGRLIRSYLYDFQLLNINFLPDGLYYIKIGTDKGIVSKKFIKN